MGLWKSLQQYLSFYFIHYFLTILTKNFNAHRGLLNLYFLKECGVRVCVYVCVHVCYRKYNKNLEM